MEVSHTSELVTTEPCESEALQLTTAASQLTTEASQVSFASELRK